MPYTGLISDLLRRLAEHNAGLSPHTRRYRPWLVVAKMEFAREAAAVAFERYLKSGSGRAFAKRHFL
jgi:predicted GIY-YIG superfamily endonuclease